MLEPDSGIGSVRVVVARRAVSLLSNRTFGAWITWTRNLCCGTISRLWTKNSLVGFCSGECPLAGGPMRSTPKTPPEIFADRFAQNRNHNARVFVTVPHAHTLLAASFFSALDDRRDRGRLTSDS